MTLIAAIADSHFDETKRFDETIRIHSWIADDIATRRPELIIHTGDVFERKSTPRERYAVARWLRALAEIAPVVIVRGNHDAVDDLPLFERLKTRHGIEVYERAGVVRIGDTMLALLGWPQKAHILANAESRDQAMTDSAEALRNVLRHLGTELAGHGGPRIFAGHCMVRGSRVSTGQPMMGCDYEIGLEDLALVGADAYLLGHIHLGQEWMIEQSPVIYPGSPRRTNFGEVESKGYAMLRVAIDTYGDTQRTWERIETPCTPMLLIEEEWGCEDGSDHQTWLVGLHGEPRTDEGYRGAEVRFRYYVRGDMREAARAAVGAVRDHFIDRGAVNVQVEEVVEPERRARMPEVAHALTLADQLQELWKAQNFDPGLRRDPLLSKLHEVEIAA